MRATGKLRLLLLKSSGEAGVAEIQHTLPELQHLVGGLIETFALRDQLRSRSLIGLCNEEGKLEQLPHNPFARVLNPLLGGELVGNLLVVRSRGEEFASLRATDLELLSLLFYAEHLEV